MQILQRCAYVFQFHYFYQVLFILISMEQKILILINDAPYGTEKAYNGLRLAMQLQRLQFLINIFATAQKISLNYKFKIWRVYYEIA
jgi:hypothetical protein